MANRLWRMLRNAFGCKQPSDLREIEPPRLDEGRDGGPVPSARVNLLHRRIPEWLIIILVSEPDEQGDILDIQNYVINGENVIPLFTSKEALIESLDGSKLGRPVISMKRSLVAQVIRGDEVFLLDPQRPTELRFTAAEFRAAFPEPFATASAGDE